MLTVENFIKGIKNNFQFLSVENDNKQLSLKRQFRDEATNERNQVIAQIPISELQDIESELAHNYKLQDLGLWNKTSFEVAIQSHNRMLIPLSRLDFLIPTESQRNYEFSVSKATKRFIFSLFCRKKEHSNSDFDLINIRLYQDKTITSVEDFFALFRIITAKITSNKNYTVAGYMRLLDSYLLNISFNYNITFTVAESLGTQRSFKRGLRRDGQLFPYNQYKPELTKYYRQAIAANIPFIQYIAFYHVAEYFFELLSEQDICQEIQRVIRRPSFSPNNSKNIKLLYTSITKKIKKQRDDGVGKETNGLLLCLRQFVPNLNDLKDTIETIDSSAIDYYNNTPVEFANDGKTINFEDVSIDKVYKNIRDRVYSVRNAIVHSKEGNKLRYEPFNHDEPLAKEVPLIRAIAEEIIMNSAEPMNL